MLENKGIKLLPLEENHLKLIQEWQNNYDITKYTTVNSFLPKSYNEEKKWFERKNNDPLSKVFIIEVIAYSELVGFVSYSNLDYRNQKAYLSIVIGNKDFHGKGIASQALQSIEYLMKCEFNIRKLTVQVLAYNTPSLILFQRNGYIVEGILKEEVYRDGKFHDIHLLSKFI